MARSQVVGSVDGVQLETEARLAVQSQQEPELLTLLKEWIQQIRTTLLARVETLPTGEYTLLSEVGTWTVRLVPGRDPSGSAFALQIWLRNGAQTRFMAIFAYRQQRVYNIDSKLLDARFVWWVRQLSGGTVDEEGGA